MTDLESLRTRIETIQSRRTRQTSVLPFGIPVLDSRLPEGGLARGVLHEIAGGGRSGGDAPAAALFVAGIAARTKGKVLWCLTRPDLFAPALAQAGLAPDRVIYVEAQDDKTVLACMEEGLAHGGPVLVVGETARLSMTASRRLNLAAEKTGALAIVLRRWSRPNEAADFGRPTAAATRWRISARPAAPLPAPGVGRARWHVELLRCRGGEPAAYELEACDETGRLALPSDLPDRPAMPRPAHLNRRRAG
ncbi:damage-inducible protein [Jiella sp. MQZ9-1]|uniref:Damage-inducible protein n=1 Tax=Jiella flava TaxID=2816857 RepID=A0A939G212_9HYPH|nr:damage-inducible protein [Jiella flava]MBO0664435.1 damage-inducible protein [Jiella flava]MCD2473071.1 damage-inducible protein [Jiella flava]